MSALRAAVQGLRPSKGYFNVQHRPVNILVKRRLSLYQNPHFENEPLKEYKKGSQELQDVQDALENLKTRLPLQIPLVIGGAQIKNSSLPQINPAKHQQVIAEWTPARAVDVPKAIEAAMAAKPTWENLPFEDRAAVFLRAAELISGKYRYELMAATMLNQGKNVREAEIDAAAESCDLLRFNVQCALEMFKQQPAVHPKGMWNRMEYRPLEGFVYAIAPFNFTALIATLACGPLLMGNVVLLKPSLSALQSSYLFCQILHEAGLPKDVLQFIPGDAEEITSAVLESSQFAGLNFTGSTTVFQRLIAKIGAATGEGRFLSYPRIVGETGGKNFHLVHKSAEVENAVNCTIRGAFEFQGQKCSAPSRLYVSESIWPHFKKSLLAKMETIQVGSPEVPRNYVNPIIHEQAFDRMAALFERAKTDPKLTLIAGGKADKNIGYFVHPTVYQVSDPRHEIMQTEFFGPMVSVYVYPDAEWEKIPQLVDSTSKYALTGSIFATDPAAIRHAYDGLKHSAGNFYVNTKSTGSVVGQQPFGGSRGSGTNDKVGSVNTLSRFVSVRTVKEDFEGTREFSYPNFEA
ncbi:Delta-1-pyrroline-5-carboxylate dehydrogenase [Coleophoma cylindrospora]|uniref:Multifunctional fusion protein n=1 Tax=Coleophoma cylindrospora TaxID=1849047 RepID=A0A3D8RUI5_9HELO|nr:Delta-1-pyrroline-5-carboxylate dehydrogenase [Coleophoma cylindrospora]